MYSIEFVKIDSVYSMETLVHKCCVCFACLLVGLVFVISGVEANVQENQHAVPIFDVWEYRISGNTVLTNRQIETAVYPYLGPDKSFNDVQAAQQALQEIYKTEGYSFANVIIPEQDVDNGVVNIKVSEGKVSRVKVSGNKYFSRKEILADIPSLQKDAVVQLPELQSELALLNRENPDRQITPLARPGRDPESVEIELKVKDALPLKAGVEYNGRNSPDTTRTRASAFISYSNLWQKNHNISFNYQTTPEDRDEVEVKSVNYSMPLFTSDNRLVMYYIDSDSNIATVGDTLVVGQGEIFGAKTLFPFYSSGNLFQSLSFGVESKDFDQLASLVTGAEQSTPIRYTTFNSDYLGSYRLDDSLFSFGLGTRLGLRGFGNTQEEFEGRRAGAKNNFIYFVGNLGFAHTFDSKFQLSARSEIQITSDPLIGNEQYSAGGQYNVRGYLTSQELTDEAIFGSIELRSPDLSDLFSLEMLPSFKLITFLDYAKLHNRGALPGEDANIRLAGAGIGLRANLFDYFFVSLDIARALSDSSEGSDSIDSGHTRAHFSLSSQF